MRPEEAAFGVRLRALRLAAGLNVAELASAAGLPVTSVYRFERGVRGPRWGHLLRLVAALNVGLGAFQPDQSKPPARARGKRK